MPRTIGTVLRNARGRLIRGFRELRTYFSLHHLGGPKTLKLQPDDVVLVCLIKNGVFWLDTFMNHHMSLGVAHCVFVDNGSTDSTLDYLLSKDKVTVVQSTLPVKHYESYLRRHAIRRFATGRWCLCVDSDELFGYHHSDTLPLKGLISYLDREGYTCIIAQMLDMFPEGPIGDIVNSDEFAETFIYYDLTGIHAHDYHSCVRSGFSYFTRENSIGSPDIKWLFGGIRATHFGTDVALTKHALIRVSRTMIPSTHPHCSGRVKCADISALIRHYKLAGGSRRRIEEDVNSGTWETGEPEKYLQRLESTGNLILKLETSQRFSGTDALVAAGFLVTSEKFQRWVLEYRQSCRKH